jgi:hypothetical protein
VDDDSGLRHHANHHDPDESEPVQDADDRSEDVDDTTTEVTPIL